MAEEEGEQEKGTIVNYAKEKVGNTKITGNQSNSPARISSALSVIDVRSHFGDIYVDCALRGAMSLT